MKLSGTVEQLTAEIKRRKDIQNPDKFLQAIKYFAKLRDMCKIHKLLEAGAKNNNGESELRYEKKLSCDRTYYNTDKIIRKDKKAQKG